MKALTDLTCSRSMGVHEVINHEAVVSQSPTLSAANTNVPLPLSFCPFAVGAAVTTYSSPASVTATERDEIEVEKEDGANDGHLYVIFAWDLPSVCSHDSWYCRNDVHESVDASLALARSATEKSPPPTDSVAQDKPSPPVPPRIVGSKRKFVEDRSTYSNSINPPRKISALPCVFYVTVMHLYADMSYVVGQRGKRSSMRTIPLTRDWEWSRPCTTEGWGLNYPRPSSLPLAVECPFGPHRVLLPGTRWMEKRRTGATEGANVNEDMGGGVGSYKYYRFDITKRCINAGGGQVFASP
jgi:hypothetical protein